MGSDKSIHSRRAKRTVDLKRKKESKSEYKTILIICEGTKTEPLYFRELISDLRLNTANISVVPSRSTCPLNLVQFARQKASEGDYDSVYCVFDQDTHSKYSDAVNLIRELGNQFVSAQSVPCFEFWLLLHFDYTDSPFRGTSRKSSGDVVVDKLKKKIVGYEKSQIGIYALLKDKTDVAMKNAARANAAAERAKTDNPTTYVNVLVSELIDIRRKMEA